MDDEQNIENTNLPESTPEKLTIGQQLQAARQAKGLSIDNISNQTKIKKTFIEYLENNEFEKFHNLMTAKGLLKVYAGMLNLSVDEIHRQFIELFPSEAGYKPGREVTIGMTVDKRTLFPAGLKNMNSPGLSHSHTSYSKHSKKANKLLVRIIAVIVIISTALILSTMYFKSSMSDIKNQNLRQKSDISVLEAKDTPEASQQKEYDKNKIYIEATALADTFVTIVTVDDGRTLSQTSRMRRGDLRSWDGNQYIRIRSTSPRSLRLKVNGKNEGILEETEKMFYSSLAEDSAETLDKPIEKNTPKPEPTPPPPPPVSEAPQTNNEPDAASTILNNI